ncbi:winged helix-turn-helix domain-containing protein [Methanolobus sp. ZRKC2]|uniref:helix-turn-helix transcriptional regulator n=1 Tax=Methanolobus sp. ZRKC2 TaxID=3125783 RepID=UPI00324F5088
MIPQVKKLLEWNLIIYEGDKYALTPTGEAIVENMEKLLMSLSVHEKNMDYWTDHDLSPIPKELLFRIGELGTCEILEPNLPSIFEQEEEMLKRIDGSSRISTFISIYHPSYLLPYSSFLEQGVDVKVIMTEEVYNLLKEDIHSEITEPCNENPLSQSLKREYEKEIEILLEEGSSHISICKQDVKPVSITVSDLFMSFSLLDKNGRYTNRIILSSESKAIEWGEELFQYYKDRSESLNY